MLSRSELTTGHGRAAEMAVARARHALQGAEPLVSTASATWYEEDERDLCLCVCSELYFYPMSLCQNIETTRLNGGV